MRYPKYKDSGVEWIGEIPVHWEVKKLKFLGESIIGITYNPKNITTDNGYLVLRASNIQNGKLNMNDCVYINIDIPEKLLIKKGDILICARSGSQHLIGKNICINKEIEHCTFGVFMTVFRTKYYKFISKYFNSQVFIGQSSLFLTTTINQLTKSTLNNFIIALPSFPEQTQIANFLDRKTKLIDTLIEKKQKQIELLKEQRAAVINQVVTKGLNPDVPMKDSGVDWLGEIPEHWEVKNLKYLIYLINKKTKSLQDISLKISLESIESKTGKLLQEYSNFGGIGCLFKKGDILFSKLRPYLAKVIIAPDNGQAVGELLVLRPKKECGTRFLFYRILSNSFISIVDGSTYGTKMPRANWEFIGNLSLPKPPLLEQTQIADFLDCEIKKIGDQIDKINQQIDLLKEYRTTLISEAVTGKIDVRSESQMDADAADDTDEQLSMINKQ